MEFKHSHLQPYEHLYDEDPYEYVFSSFLVESELFKTLITTHSVPRSKSDPLLSTSTSAEKGLQITIFHQEQKGQFNNLT